MGKWSKLRKLGLYGSHHSPDHHRNETFASCHRFGSFGHKKKHFKKMHKLRHLMKHLNIPPNDGINDNKAICSLCSHQIKPLVETEILECGHIYHRLCLKELFFISLRHSENKMFCTQCKSQIDNQFVDDFQTRIAVQLSLEVEQNTENEQIMNTED
jgi:hypothetical protein